MNQMQIDHWENHWQHPKYRRLSMEQAMEIARARVPGEVVEAELEFKDSGLIFEINIRTNEGMKYEVHVDAVSGQILKVKQD